MENRENNSASDDINIKDLIQVIANKWKIVIFTTLLFALISVFYAISLNDVYTSSSLLKASKDPSSTSSIGSSGVGGLAALAGISVGSSDDDPRLFATTYLKSHQFLEHILTFDDVLENIMAAKGYDKDSKLIIYDSDIFDKNTNKWIRDIPTGRNLIPSALEVKESQFDEDFYVNLDFQSGYITISYTHFSPIFAKDFLELVIREINLISKEKDLSESQSSLNFLFMKSAENKITSVDLTINELIKSELRKETYANARLDYLLTPIDKPFLPEKKSAPSRATLCILITVLGFILSLIYIVFNNYIYKFNKKT
ncbi:Wzz/FepE/Etk N-terminal domain-containing protein [Gammaproteobacteria bacterium]|nr:Wzz/FepE/Etk N-terminal domain-containing protein [Gammaproteobacteria bacterium]